MPSVSILLVNTPVKNQNTNRKYLGIVRALVSELPEKHLKKSLKIPNRSAESVNRRRTVNTITKRKSTEGQTTIYKTYT